MSTPAEAMREQVQITVGGLTQSGWTRYEVDSDFLTPADAWQVSLATRELKVPPEVRAGAPVVVRLAGQVVMTGLLDERQISVDGNRVELSLTGRDAAAVLLDCSAPITSGLQLSLAEVVARIVRPLGIAAIRIDADVTLSTEKVSTEPGDTAWDALRRAAEANGLWPWFEPDGTLVVGGPSYDVAPVATLVLRRPPRAEQNNVLSLVERHSMAERASEVTVLGQAAAAGDGTGERDARSAVRAVVRDSGVQAYRPRIVVDHEATTEAVATARARKIISDARLKGYTLTAQVQGHRVAPNGPLWAAGQRVNVISEPHELDATFFVMARRFTGDARQGQLTQLTLKEDGVWAIEAHPNSRRHRRGKNSLPGSVWDLTRGAAP